MAVRRKTELLVVHVTATNPDNRLTSAALLSMHKARGFSGIGYNEWIDRDANIQPGRGVYQIGAHVAGYNSISYGISLEGGYKEFDATPAMMKTLENRLRQMAEKFPGAKVCGHRDLSPDADGDGIVEPHEHVKLCPQFDAIPWAEKLGLPAADIKGVWETHTEKGPDDRIRWLQKLLRNLGYNVGPVDGISGPKTVGAILEFQANNSLERNGQFDEPTVKTLRAANGT